MSGCVRLFAMFFRIGIFGFGGGYAMLPLIFQSVQDFGVMSQQEFSNLVALSQVTPGPIAVNAATYVGFNSEGLAGAACATLGVALPSFALVLAAMFFLGKFKESKIIQGAFAGIRPATVGLVAAASVLIAQTALVSGPITEVVAIGGTFAEFAESLGSYFKIIPCAIFACSLILIGKFKVSPIAVTVLMGTIGAFVCGQAE